MSECLAHIALAPMMKVSDRHFRYLLRLISPNVWLYTEMVTAATLCHGQDINRWLAFDKQEHPVVLQLGGSDPKQLARAVDSANAFRYDQINLNIGCPSERVQSGRFGACLMREPTLVASCVAAMQGQTSVPITVKTRIGVDQDDDYAFLKRFVDVVAEAGCQKFIIHARKAWLKGLSPKQNRQIPPLDYSRVWQLKKDFPELTIIANGGLDTIDNVKAQLVHCDGVMIGRKLHQSPLWLAELECALNLREEIPDRLVILNHYWKYVQNQLDANQRWSVLMQPLFGLAWGLAGAKQWRATLASGNRVSLESLESLLQL